MKIEVISAYRCITGESPRWNPIDNMLYWLDIPTGRIFYYNPKSDKSGILYSGEIVGGMTVQRDGALLLFMRKGAIKILKRNKLTTIIDEVFNERDGRFNDVITDPQGRVFCGTMPSKQHFGSLYRLDINGHLTHLLDNIECSNGMGFTPNRKKMYYTDSPTRNIYIFDYNEKNGSLTNQKVFIHTIENGFPDGMTVDVEGGVWSAFWDGAHIVRYTPDGKKDRHISLPCQKVTSLTFGGNDYKDMYITTALGGDKSRYAGALLRIRLNVQGTSQFLSRVNV